MASSTASPATTSLETRLAIEHGATQVLGECATLSEAAPRLISTVCETLGWECGVAWQVDAAGAMRCVDTWGMPLARVHRFLALVRDRLPSRHAGGLIGRTWLSGEPLWMSDVTADPTFRRAPLAVEAGLHSAFAFPITAGGKTLGVIEFFSREIREPDPELLGCMQYVGSQIGQFCQRTEAQRRLHESDQRYHETFDLAPVGIAHIEPHTMRFIRVNRRLCDLVGYSSDELLALTVKDVSHPEDRDVNDAARARLHAGEIHSLQREKRYLRKDGATVWVNVTVALKRDKEGRPLYHISLVEDITARKSAEHLRELEHDVTRCIADADTVSAGLQGVLETVCKAERWECGMYLRIDEATGFAQLKECWFVPDPVVEKYVRSYAGVDFKPGSGYVGRVLQSREPIWATNIAEDPRMLMSAPAREAGMHGCFVFPILAQGRMSGVLAFTTREAREANERLMQTVHVVGSQIGQFIQRKDAELAMRESEARFRSLTSLSSDFYWETDPEHRLVHSSHNSGHKVLVGLHQKSQRPWETPSTCPDEAGWAAHRATLDAHQPFRDFELARLDADGNERHLSISGEPVFDERGAFLGYRGVGKDITARRRAEQRIHYLANHDALTDLPNRHMFGQILGHAIDTAKRYNRTFAVLFIDLDRFKFINDTLGHEAGDRLLQIVSSRLKSTLRASDVVARLGGDEFVVLVQEVQSAHQVAAVARKIVSAVIKPMEISGHECRVTCSIGISMFPGDAADGRSLMKYADAAMYLAKEQGKNNFQFYTKHLKAASLERMTLETNLRKALERGELSLHYQAKQDLRSGAITGVEALLRWTNSELGSVSPAQFIPLAEETGLIVPIGRWVLRTACAQVVAWQAQGLPAVCMAVNLSPRQFADIDLLKDIQNVFRDTGMAPQLLELEITEGMVMHNPDRAIEVLAQIKAMGVRLAIDDFGTGYSSLAQLKRFPIDTLKVDRSFIRDIPADSEDKAITEAIIAMGKTLSLTVVAEGVETEAQRAFLRDHACDQMQGYYFSKPLPAEGFAAFMRAHTMADAA